MSASMASPSNSMKAATKRLVTTMDARGCMGTTIGSVGTSAYLHTAIPKNKTAAAGTQTSSMEMENGVAAQTAPAASVSGG